MIYTLLPYVIVSLYHTILSAIFYHVALSLFRSLPRSDLEISGDIYRGEYIATVEQWSTVPGAVSPGMIADIFLAEIIPSGVVRSLRAATRRSYPPKISTYRTWKKNGGGGGAEREDGRNGRAQKEDYAYHFGSVR